MKKVVREDEENNISTINGNTQNTSSTSATTLPIENKDEDDDENDPTINYILQQIKQHNANQQQQDQMEFAVKQQQADKIIKDIEEYIKNNSQK